MPPTHPSVPETRRPARAEVIGSLLKPKPLLEVMQTIYEPGHTALLAAERGKDLAALRAAQEEATREVVRRQIDAGLDVLTDGELRRYVFVNSFYDAIEGLSPSPDPLPFTDAGGNVSYFPGISVVTEKLRKVGNPAVDEIAFLRSITDHPFKVTFPAASFFRLPFLWKPGMTDRAYADPDELCADSVRIERELVHEAIEAGARYVQFDYPQYIFLLTRDLRERLASMGQDPDALFDRFVEADQAVVRDVPGHVTRALHLCRGNFRSSWMVSGGLEPVAERIFRELPYDVFLVEWEDPDREGDFAPLRHVPAGKTVVLGIVSSKSPVMETEDELLRRIDEAARYLDAGQLAISTQCGFSSAGEGNRIDEDTQWRKLELVGRVADRVWGR